MTLAAFSARPRLPTIQLALPRCSPAARSRRYRPDRSRGLGGYGAARLGTCSLRRKRVEVAPQLSHRERIRITPAGKSDPATLAIAGWTQREAICRPSASRMPAASWQLLGEAREESWPSRPFGTAARRRGVLVPGIRRVAANWSPTSTQARRRLLRRRPGAPSRARRDRSPARSALPRGSAVRTSDRTLVADHPLRSLWARDHSTSRETATFAGPVGRCVRHARRRGAHPGELRQTSRAPQRGGNRHSIAPSTGSRCAGPTYPPARRSWRASGLRARLV